MSNAALIVAAGRGTRAGGEVPKQWRKIAGQPGWQILGNMPIFCALGRLLSA